MASISQAYTSIIANQPSCIAYSPLCTELFVIGTYQLLEDAGEDAENIESKVQARSGTVQLFHLQADGITLLQTQELSSLLADTSHTPGAVLDLRFCPWQGYQDVVAVSTSTGSIILFRLAIAQPDLGQSRLKLLSCIQIVDEDISVLSLAWNPDRAVRNEGHDLAVTLADGRAATLSIDLGQQTQNHSTTISSKKTPTHWSETIHQQEAWTAQWLPPSPSETTSTTIQRILTGGDDAEIHLLTLPIPSPVISPSTKPPKDQDDDEDDEEEEDTGKALHAIDITSQRHRPQSTTHLYDDRTHTAGVTAILPLPLPLSPGILATGSYDSSLRIIQPPQPSSHSSAYPRRWKLLAECDMGGGVWKIDFLASRSVTGENGYCHGRKWLLLLSCMHAGAKIIEIRQLRISDADEWKWEIDILAVYEGHESMCYACTALPVAGKQDRTEAQDRHWRVISTSFYDRRVCVWDFEWR